MFSRWTDFYRGYDATLCEELASLLTRYDIPHRASTANPDSRVAAAYGAGGVYPGTINSRTIGYANPGLFAAAKMVEKDMKDQKLHILKVRKKDLARAQELRRSMEAD